MRVCRFRQYKEYVERSFGLRIVFVHVAWVCWFSQRYKQTRLPPVETPNNCLTLFQRLPAYVKGSRFCTGKARFFPHEKLRKMTRNDARGTTPRSVNLRYQLRRLREPGLGCLGKHESKEIRQTRLRLPIKVAYQIYLRTCGVRKVTPTVCSGTPRVFQSQATKGMRLR